jgi:hypothetical protein
MQHTARSGVKNSGKTSGGPPMKSHTIDPKTGIWPMSEWGSACQRGFVSDSRFSPSDTVIKRTNRETSRKWRRLEPKQGNRPK